MFMIAWTCCRNVEERQEGVWTQHSACWNSQNTLRHVAGHSRYNTCGQKHQRAHGATNRPLFQELQMIFARLAQDICSIATYHCSTGTEINQWAHDCFVCLVFWIEHDKLDLAFFALHQIYFQIGCIIFHLCHAERDTNNLLSASDYINFAFNFALTVTCKLKTILLIFYGAETTYT